MNGCTATKTATVAATPVIAFVLNGQNTGCNQQNGQVSASITNGIAASSYLWSNGATTPAIIGLSGGNYSLTITDVNGCTASQSTSIESLVSPQIDLGPDVEIISGQSATLDAGSGAGWTYLWSNGATSQSIIVTTTGNYTVTVTNGQGCTASDGVAVTLMTAVGVRLQAGAFLLYPNPASQVVFLEKTGASGSMQRVLVANALGQQVFRREMFLQNDNMEIPLTGWPSGLYFIQVETGDGFWTSPFVKMD